MNACNAQYSSAEMEKYMKQYQYVVFDVDGTLLDTAEGIVKAVKELSLIHI